MDVSKTVSENKENKIEEKVLLLKQPLELNTTTAIKFRTEIEQLLENSKKLQQTLGNKREWTEKLLSPPRKLVFKLEKSSGHGYKKHPPEVLQFLEKKSAKEQIPLSTFWSFVEQSFKAITEKDLDWLFSRKELVAEREKEKKHTKFSLEERIISSLVEERLVSSWDVSERGSESDREEIIEEEQPLEQRLLRKLGAASGLEIKETYKKVTEEELKLRQLHVEYKKQRKINEKRKKVLAERIILWIAEQEYHLALERIEEKIMKRYLNWKKSKNNKNEDNLIFLYKGICEKFKKTFSSKEEFYLKEGEALFEGVFEESQ